MAAAGSSFGFASVGTEIDAAGFGDDAEAVAPDEAGSDFVHAAIPRAISTSIGFEARTKATLLPVN
jgi:hypothetical protein